MLEKSNEKKDAYEKGEVVLRRKVLKRNPPYIEQILYLKPEHLLVYISGDKTDNLEQHQHFISTIQKNNFYDLHKIVGYQGGTDLFGLLTLKSGRPVSTSSSWNPVIFAFLYDHTAVINFIVENKHLIDLQLCFQAEELYPIQKEKLGSRNSLYRSNSEP